MPSSLQAKSNHAIHVTYVGTATMILEIGNQAPIRILTDPAFDQAGGDYHFGFGTGSHKNMSPAIPSDRIGAINLVLLSHDQHADNLDKIGRSLLPLSERVMTTPSGSRRLSKELGAQSQTAYLGLSPWQTSTVKTPEGWELRVTAVPALHVEWSILAPAAGDTTGFVLEWDDQEGGPIYISGDTVHFKGTEEIAKRYRVGLAFLHLGNVKFGITGNIRFTMDGLEATELAQALGAKKIIPIHYEGWSHFHEGLAESLEFFKKAGTMERVQILPYGERVQVTY